MYHKRAINDLPRPKFFRLMYFVVDVSELEAAAASKLEADEALITTMETTSAALARKEKVKER